MLTDQFYLSLLSSCISSPSSFLLLTTITSIFPSRCCYFRRYNATCSSEAICLHTIPWLLSDSSLFSDPSAAEGKHQGGKSDKEKIITKTSATHSYNEYKTCKRLRANRMKLKTWQQTGNERS